MTGSAARLDHLEALLDDTGIAQHATFAVVAREHGYCLDDNARGLSLAVGLARRAGPVPATVARLRARTASFVQHAWNDEAGRFRNFMGFDRRWSEPVGSEDSHGRAAWALGEVVRHGGDEDARSWAATLLERAFPALAGFASPRALAFGALGLVAAADTIGGDADRCCMALADRLCDHLRDSRGDGWCWFEASLSYDNARLPQALLAAGERFGRDDWLAAGRDTLDWLCAAQTAEAGHFRPVGSAGFWSRGGVPARFDQQPIEAAATVAACLLAHRQTGRARWRDEARRAHAWFGGANDLGLPLAIPATGGCRDGLHPDRVNANQGAESTLAWLQADLDLRDAEDPR